MKYLDKAEFDQANSFGLGNPDDVFLSSRIEKKLSGETYVRQILCGQ